MPYDGEEVIGNKRVLAYLKSVRNMFVPDDVAEKAYRLQVVYSVFSDPGEDWNRFDVYDIDGNKIASTTVPGY